MLRARAHRRRDAARAWSDNTQTDSVLDRRFSASYSYIFLLQQGTIVLLLTGRAHYLRHLPLSQVTQAPNLSLKRVPHEPGRAWQTHASPGRLLQREGR